MLCGNCGAKVAEIELYCKSCGSDLDIFASSTEKELEALKILEEEAMQAAESKQEAEEAGAGLFLDDSAPAPPPVSPEGEFGAGISIPGEEPAPQAAGGPDPEEAERQRRLSQFFGDDEPTPPAPSSSSGRVPPGFLVTQADPETPEAPVLGNNQEEPVTATDGIEIIAGDKQKTERRRLELDED